MENPIDHNIDLGFVNFVKHPENENYTVFRFRDENRAKSFEIELCSSNIWFEKSQSSNKGKTYFLFGIHKNDFKKAQSINFKVEAQHKKRIIHEVVNLQTEDYEQTWELQADGTYKRRTKKGIHPVQQTLLNVYKTK